jgi:hypothetical protein
VPRAISPPSHCKWDLTVYESRNRVQDPGLYGSPRKSLPLGKPFLNEILLAVAKHGTCKPVLGRLRQEDHGFKASLNYKVRPYLKNEKKKRFPQAEWTRVLP